MPDLPINGNIAEINGPYYAVRFQWIPRVGELIDLWSFVDQADGHTPAKRYQVVQVVHKMQDITEKSTASREGAHFVTVYVNQAESQFFGDS
jgi:hypothetical protein